ncbi:MAG: LysM peptidoglycan-binding domain-containing protein [Gammaproteobacteria bacterium]|nr:MAG: LysM peptidoglycan-binding domain-containing protein [Gammaproteobacteria bacterium]
MNSTRAPEPAWGPVRWLLGAVFTWLALARGFAAETPMPRPPELERDVQFWIRVYTEIDTNAGFLHDQYNLAVVYDTLHFAPSTSPRERERLVEQARGRYSAALRRIAAADVEPLSEDDQRIKDMWGERVTPARLRAAIEDIRFQLGQADRFREGLIRSGAWETHIAEALANLGLPAELAVLPHVESSFNPAAYSKVGAAGLWQFMRSTGRRYMRIDSAVDDRMDPFRSTEAAAQLLAYNYRVLGTWPLALTAYNHGTAGVRRAKESLGTDDIVKIVRNYNGRTFGFASRNFYVSFLAALDVDRNPEKYFGSIDKLSEAKFQEVTLPAFVSIASLERVLKLDRQKLRALNPALLRAVWDGQRQVPKAYHLRLPIDGEKWTSELLAQRLSPGELLVAQTEPRRYRVQPGDSLARVAERYGVTTETLARLNRMRTSAKLRVGRTITVPEVTPGAVVAAATPAPVSPTPGAAAATSAAAPTAAAAPTSTVAVAVAPAVTSAPALTGAAAPPAATATVAGTAPATAESSNVYIVRSGDSLSEIAAKAGLTEAQLLQLNGIRNRDFIFEGQQLVVKAPPAAAVASTAAPNIGTERPGAPTQAPGAAPAPAGEAPALVAQRESAEEAAAVATGHGPAENSQPVSAAQAEALSPSLGPAADTQQSADPTDYSVAKDDTIQVAAAETLGHYADWLSVTAAHLRQINRMSYGRPVLIGHKLRLDFHKVAREEFEQRRREYHQALQAAYFASHRIVGTEIYIARRGDTLWTVTQRFSQLPVWLLQEYNPDLDLADLHPGTQIVMPRVETVIPGAG